jgi:hypothetical protein
MITRIVVSIVASLFVASVAFSQMRYSRPRTSGQSPTPTPTPTAAPMPPQRVAPSPAQMQTKPSPTPLQRTMQTSNQQRMMPMQPRPSPTFATIPSKVATTPAPPPMKPTPTPVPPPDVKAYLDRQLASAKDKKFHMTVNGGDLALTPFHVWAQKSTGPNTTSTSISMRSDEGRVYDIDFLTAGAQVTGIKISRINGEAVR